MSDKMIKDGEEGRFVSTFWLDQATNSFNLVKGMLEENIASVKSLRHSVSIRDTTIDTLYKLAEEKDVLIKEKDARIELRNETIMELRKAIQDKTDALEEQSYTIKDLNRVIAEYRNLTGETK